MRLLVTGGAGYIGSVVAAQLADDGHDVAVLDDLSTGHEDAVPAAAAFHRGTITRATRRPCSAPGSTRCSTSRPSRWSASRSSSLARYWENNLGGTLALLEAMRVTGTRRIVFSSTAAVYGEPEHIPIAETDPVRPTSPYGASKVAVDTALAAYARMHQLGAVSLRYFNVAGAHADAAGTWRGERHHPGDAPDPHHPRRGPRRRGRSGCSATTTRRPTGPASGTTSTCRTWPAPTCWRWTPPLPGSHRVYNLGSGTGYSNREVLAACREVTGREIPAQVAPRRPGDPAVLVASSEAIAADLGWRPERDLRSMVADAWTFAQHGRLIGPVTAR